MASPPYRGSAPELDLPPGSGVIICSPACPARPEGSFVWLVDHLRTEASV